MHVELVRPDELSDDHLLAWHQILVDSPSLDSAYFRPEFTQHVGAVRGDVEVAVLRRGGEIFGFFPFQRFSQNTAKPVGGRLSDFQAIIARQDESIQPVELLRGCGLLCWDFDHLVTTDAAFEPYTQMVDGSPYLDLSEGFDGYLRLRREMGCSEIKQTQRKARKMVREVGPIRLVAHTENPDVLRAMFRWKSEQYQRTGITDVFSFPWTVQLIRDLLDANDPGFRSRLSALYVGDRLAAVHFGMECNGVLHYWFPSYNLDLAAHSPGRVLLLRICEAADSLGIRRIDMGRGMATFKTRAMTHVTNVAVGSVDRRPITRALRSSWRRTRDWVKNSPLRVPAQAPARLIYHLREWLEFR